MKSITTRTGDGGSTHLFSGEAVSKDSPRMEVCGDVDEVVSILGIARSLTTSADRAETLLKVQRALFVVGAEVAMSERGLSRLERRVDAAFLAELDAVREALEARLPRATGFIVPGEHPVAAHIDLARAVARRCERRVVALLEQGVIYNKVIQVWLNRLSDYLWLLAREEEGTSRPLKEKDDE